MTANDNGRQSESGLKSIQDKRNLRLLGVRRSGLAIL
jgi:hypothetical protein